MNKLQSGTDKKKVKKFQPCTTPRYLPGSLPMRHIIKDLETYNNHLYNKFIAVTKLDTKPPQFHPSKYLKMINVSTGAQRMRLVDKQNKEMLRKINMINRNKGCIDTWNPNAYVSLSTWRQKELDLRRIEKENHNFYQRLINTKSQYPKEEHDNFYMHVTEKMESFSKYPHYKLRTRDDDLRENYPSISCCMEPREKMERPKCFIVFTIDGLNIKLGKIVVELYNDIVPKLVDKFLEAVRGENDQMLQNCQVSYMSKNKFLMISCPSMDFKKGGNDEQTEDEVEEDFSLKHTKPGVLSLASRGQIYITFDKMNEFNDKYTAFGKVVKGAEGLFKVNDMGKAHGKPSMSIVISSCGPILAKTKKKKNVSPV